jgi:hypothetical protein
MHQVINRVKKKNFLKLNLKFFLRETRAPNILASGKFRRTFRIMANQLSLFLVDMSFSFIYFPPATQVLKVTSLFLNGREWDFSFSPSNG